MQVRAASAPGPAVALSSPTRVSQLPALPLGTGDTVSVTQPIPDSVSVVVLCFGKPLGLERAPSAQAGPEPPSHLVTAPKCHLRRSH